MKISRRQFLEGAAATSGALALSGVRARTSPLALLPRPDSSGIEHVVVVMMENRSFDHYLGWLPGADGMQAGLKYVDSNGEPHDTYHLPDYQGCGHPDPDHSFGGGRVEYDDGACDGWLRAGRNDIYAIGYYIREDLPFLGEAALNWTTFDRYFPATMAPTFPNRIFQHAAQTDRTGDSFEISTLPTIWDTLAEAGLTGRYYYGDIPFLALWGARYLSISRPFAAFLIDCAFGILPQVSFVDPRFLGEDWGTANDDHPHADIRNGQAFLYQVYRAVTRSPAWPRTVLIFNYDEWGGFFDHVPPPPAGGDDPNYGLRGFRVPCLLVSPWAPRGQVSRHLYDHTSILKMIECRWDLDPLTGRDANADNIADVLDFSHRDLTAPRFAVPGGPFGEPCEVGAQGIRGEATKWETLKTLAHHHGWPLL